MADVDKALPNVEQTINIPSEADINVELEEQQKDPQALLMFKPMTMVVSMLTSIHHK